MRRVLAAFTIALLLSCLAALAYFALSYGLPGSVRKAGTGSEEETARTEWVVISPAAVPVETEETQVTETQTEGSAAAAENAPETQAGGSAAAAENAPETQAEGSAAAAENAPETQAEGSAETDGSTENMNISQQPETAAVSE